MFPFKEIDGDVQQYAQRLYLDLNFPSTQLAAWLDKRVLEVQQEQEVLKKQLADEEAGRVISLSPGKKPEQVDGQPEMPVGGSKTF